MDLPEPRPLTLEVRAREQFTPLMTRVVVGGDDLVGFEFAPGQDLMLAIPTDASSNGGDTIDTINRRYTIRRADPAAGTVDLDFVVHGHGPGSRWATDAPIGSTVTALGPRGKVVPVTGVDWHLFVCDESGWAASAAMTESLPASTRAVLVADVAGEDEQQALDAAADVYVSWCNRDGGPVGASEQVLAALDHLTLPEGRGHAYLSAEFAVVRAVGQWLADHGVAADDVSPKAYWRRGAANAAHGEPLRD
jgi:NADPH-dependent ferric siderophore reductase